jgi:hypothetical protein
MQYSNNENVLKARMVEEMTTSGTAFDPPQPTLVE